MKKQALLTILVLSFLVLGAVAKESNTSVHQSSAEIEKEVSNVSYNKRSLNNHSITRIDSLYLSHNSALSPRIALFIKKAATGAAKE